MERQLAFDFLNREVLPMQLNFNAPPTEEHKRVEHKGGEDAETDKKLSDKTTEG